MHQEVFDVFKNLIFEEANSNTSKPTPKPTPKPTSDQKNPCPAEGNGIPRLALLAAAAAGDGFSAGDQPLSPASVLQESARMLQVLCAV
jgi:hypothetical protein